MALSRKRCTLTCHIDDGIPLSEIAHIEDVMAEIFARLPVNSLFSLKLACKQWYEVISRPHFTRLHFNYNRKNGKVILYIQPKNPVSLDLHLLDKDSHIQPYTTIERLGEKAVQIVSFFIGLMCCTSLRFERTFVVNPATRKFLTIPDGSPTKMAEALGVVFDVEPAEYKVVRFYSGKSFRHVAHSYNCEVYCPKRHSWTQVGTDLPRPLRNSPTTLLRPHLCVGGRMYWFVWKEGPQRKVDHILSIGMDEIIRRVELPSLPGDAPSYLFDVFTYLITYRGNLGIFYLEKKKGLGGIYTLVDPDESKWKLVGFASYWFSWVREINSIVEIDDELLFVLKVWDGRFHFRYLNLDTMLWREAETSFLRRGGFRPRMLFHEYCEAMAFPFCESSFKCRGE